MSLVVVGSVALDSVETPSDKRTDQIGGSGSYFSYAASFFSPVALIGVVGNDWPSEFSELLEAKGVDISGLEMLEDLDTFRWSGRYQPNMNDRDTLDLQLGALAAFNPKLSDAAKKSEYVFLANDPPALQRDILQQCESPKLSIADTMDHWIETERSDLDALLAEVDGLIINDSEAILMTGESNLVVAAKKLLAQGPRIVIVKKGEHGVMFFSKEATFVLPAYPTGDVVDPTGAGDSFAGAMMGRIAETGDFTADGFRDALGYATVLASFNVEGFGLETLEKLDRDKINARLSEFREMARF